MHTWPSGLRSCVQVAVSSDAWVRIPQNAIIMYIYIRMLTNSIHSSIQSYKELCSLFQYFRYAY